MMRDYAVVSPHFWTGETGRALRESGSDVIVVAFYLMTAPSANMLGLYYLPLPTLCHDTGLDLEGASKALRRVSDLDFAHWDAQTAHVWVVEMARFQVGERLHPKDKRVTGIARQLDAMKKCRYARDFYAKYAGPFHLPVPSWLTSEPETLPSPIEAPPKKPLRSQEQEQEQEQEQKTQPCASNDDAQPSAAEAEMLDHGNGHTPAETPPVVASMPRRASRRASIPARDRPGALDGFAAFWAVYPKKKDKLRAEEAWGKLHPDPELQATMLVAVERDKRSEQWLKDRGQFVPLLASWINGKRWTDEPDRPGADDRTRIAERWAGVPAGRHTL